MSLSERIRPNSEAAPWVCEEVAKLEAERDRLREALERLYVIARKDSTIITHCKQELDQAFDAIAKAQGEQL